jgi:hypothetical protein
MVASDLFRKVFDGAVLAKDAAPDQILVLARLYLRPGRSARGLYNRMGLFQLPRDSKHVYQST